MWMISHDYARTTISPPYRHRQQKVKRERVGVQSTHLYIVATVNAAAVVAAEMEIYNF